MIQEIALSKLLGFPAFFWAGIIALIFFLATLAAGHLLSKGKIPIAYHKRLALLAFLFVAIHAILAASVFIFKF